MGSERRNAQRWIVNEQVAVATMKLRGGSWQVRVTDESATGCQVNIDKPIAIREGQEVRLLRRNCERIYEVRRVQRITQGMQIGMRYVAEIVHDDRDARISESLGAAVVKVESRRNSFFNILALLTVVVFVGVVTGGFFAMSGENADEVRANLYEDLVNRFCDSKDQGQDIDPVDNALAVPSNAVEPAVTVTPVSLPVTFAVRQQEVRDELSRIKELADGSALRQLRVTMRQQAEIRQILSRASTKLSQSYDDSSEVKRQAWMELSSEVLSQARNDVLRILTPDQRQKWQLP